MHDLAMRPGSHAERPRNPADATSHSFYAHTSADRVLTQSIVADSIRAQYPQQPLTILSTLQCDLLAFAAAGHARARPAPDAAPLGSKDYLAPAKRLDGAAGSIGERVVFGKYLYKWQGAAEFAVYVVDGRDGTAGYPAVTLQYLVGLPEQLADALIHAAGRWTTELHEEIWVFDQGFWQKDEELFKSVGKASWDDVILDPGMKDALQKEVTRFFDSRERYDELKVPWKRGVIFWGPPGNGKTISIKATMNALQKRAEPVPSLYVRSLTSFGGPEYSVGQIFAKARSLAPCLLIFEDLDSLVTDQVRSFFLNALDGLQSNDGVFMIGSTNHLDRLDPGISKRPSRFDRKYEFPKPDMAQRVQYCEYWRGKLADNKEIEFPKKLSTCIAGITDKFSFAFMQEAFVSALLSIASDETPRRTGCGDVDDLELWRAIQKQVALLRDEM